MLKVFAPRNGSKWNSFDLNCKLLYSGKFSRRLSFRAFRGHGTNCKFKTCKNTSMYKTMLVNPYRCNSEFFTPQKFVQGTESWKISLAEITHYTVPQSNNIFRGGKLTRKVVQTFKPPQFQCVKDWLPSKVWFTMQ